MIVNNFTKFFLVLKKNLWFNKNMMSNTNSPNENLDKSHPLREQIQIQSEEINWSGLGCFQPDTGERAFDPDWHGSCSVEGE
jgi:hypothetical protein